MYDGCGWFVSQYSSWRGIACFQKRAWWKRWKDISTETLVELAELVLKNDIYNFNEKTFLKKEAQQLGQSLIHPKVFYYGRIWGKNSEKDW